MNEVERVKRAISFDKPDRIPILLFNRDFDLSDIIITEVINHWDGKNKDVSEWGFVWEKHDGTMGQPKEPLIKSWSKLGDLCIPVARNPARFLGVKSVMEKYTGKYHVASLALSGFTIMTILRGFAEVLEGLYDEREKVEALADIVFGFEERVIEECYGRGFNAVGFFDDWGTQTGLIIAPDMWREFFKPRYSGSCYRL